jgi:mono/diheme cytochrome c family protein
MKSVSSLSGSVRAAGGEPPEPRAGNAFQTPMWFIALLGISLYWGTMYLDRNGGAFNPLVFNRGERLADVEARVPKSDADLLLVEGRKVYGIYCVACHQPNGRGVPNQFPPLAESDWVNVDGTARLIRIVLHGLSGPITVNGAEYNNVMLPWRDQLSDDDIAAVLTFVRGNKEWGNRSGPVTAAEVRKIREATASRDSNWTAAELLAIPLQD